jgi:hypothetical protein
MSEPELRSTERARPLVAVVCGVPLLGEAMQSALDFAEVRLFSEKGGDVAGLLEWIRPDAVVVDTHDGAEAAAPYALAQQRPLLHIGVRERELRLFHQGEWRHVGNGEGPTPEAIRNVVAGALFAREGVR